MKKILASSLFAIFACFNAFALDWTNNGEDLSSINAQIICNGNDCTLSNINAGDITDRININGVTGLNSFIFADTNSNGDPTRINYNSPGNFALNFSGFQGNNIELNGDVVSINEGVGLLSSNLTGNFISSGKNTAYKDNALAVFESTIKGNFISSGTNSNNSDSVYGALMLYKVTIHGDFVSSGINFAKHAVAIRLDSSIIHGNVISSGNNTANVSNAVSISGSTINNDVIFSGINRASDYVFSVHSNKINGDFIHEGITVAGKINPDDTIDATGNEAMFFYNTILNKNFINSGTIASATQGIKFINSRIVDDIINSGNIFGGTGSTDYTAGLSIYDTSLGGKIQNEQTGIISGGYGVTMSQDYMWGPGGSYDAKNLHIINNGLIKGYQYDAIAFDITSEHGGSGGSYNNILTYSGNGKLESETSRFDIDMGAGDDVINFTDVRNKWFKINGAETININNYIVESTYIDDSTPMHDHTDIYTNVFNISNMTFLVDTENTYTTDSNLWIMKNVGVLTDENLSNMTLVLQGYNNVDGYFFMDGSDLKYYLSSFGSDKTSYSLAAMSPVPSISAQASSIISAQGFNRSAMNLVSGRMMKLYSYTNFKNKTPDTSGLWVQGFGEKSKYDGKIEHNTVQSVGYDSNRYGIVLGFDKQIGDNVLIGAALSYGTGEVQGELNQFNIDLKQYQLSLYGSYNMNNYFIDAQVGVGTTKYDQERADVLNNALSEYNSNSISFSIGAGYVLKTSDKLSITPYHRISYIKSNQDSYTDSSNLRIDAIELKSVQASFGTEIAYKLLDVSKFKWQPRAFIEYAAELGDDEIAIGSQYMDTMTIGTTGYTPDLGNNILRTGIGIMMMGSNNDYTLGLDYRYELRENYSSHGLIINGKMFF